MDRRPLSLRGKVAIVGVGQTTYYKYGTAPDPEFVLALKAILAACEDAGVDPRDVDGFASFSNDRNDPSRIAAALGCHELRFSNMQWGGGGGGGAAATANAAAAIAGGLAKRVIVFRSLAQGQFGRFGQGLGYGQASDNATVSGDTALLLPYGLISPAQRHAIKVSRFMYETGVKQDAFKAVALACYHHAQNNPQAVMYGRPLDAKKYDESRWIVEPFHLFDSCLENDGAAALLLVAAEEARDCKSDPAYLLGAAAGSQYRAVAASFNVPDLANAGFKPIVKYLYEMAGLTPKDIDAVQSYENFTGAVVMSLIEHGFFAAEEANEFLKLENLIAPGGRLPLNTSGGNLAECYMHGLGLQIEAVRQIRGQSVNQVPDLRTCLVSAGPLVSPVSSVILGSKATL
jgi:acetyl-CoA acetyltransferase